LAQASFAQASPVVFVATHKLTVMAQVQEHGCLVGENLKVIQDVHAKIARLERLCVENYASTPTHAKIVLHNIFYSLRNDGERAAVAQSFNMISAIARKAKTSEQASVACKNLMEQGIAATIASTLMGLTGGHLCLYGSPLPDTLLAAADLAKVSSQMQVRLMEAGILEKAAAALMECGDAAVR